jgi:two-component system CheB/CheR fusion protein
MNKKKPAAKPKASKKKIAPPAKKDFLVVGLGASAGGVRALKDFFAAMPPNSGMAFVVILHLAPQYESNLDQVLQTQTTMPVIQVNASVEVEPNRVYVIPPNHNLEMFDGVIRCAPPEPTHGSRVVIDIFFRTLAAAYGRNAVCVVLSGTGSDGTLGLKRIKESNGFAVVQSPDDAEYDQMPRSAIATNLADWVLPVSQMSEKLITLKYSSERMHLTDGDDEKVEREIKGEESLREILTLLRIRTGHDFSNYKRPTLIRRIARHLQIHELANIPAYLEYLRERPEEIQSLLKNLLINVTNFFRDKEAFEALEHEVVPHLFAGKTARDTVRVWVAACASGEEAYSIAMLLCEYAEKMLDPPKIQVFASDVDDESIAEAREHIYRETITEDVSPERLARFFIRDGAYYRVKKELRELVLFAPHNVLRDPPFSRLDLVTCRNLLIYLNRETQERVLQIFHFALNANGYLFLGNSESADTLVDIYNPVNKKQRIYKRRAMGHQAPNIPPQMPVAGKWRVPVPEDLNYARERRSIGSIGEMHYKLVEQFAPPSLLVNADFEIMHLSESAGRYLRFTGGEPSNNLLKMVHTDLLPDIRASLFLAQRDGSSSEIKNIRAEIEGVETSVSIYVRPARMNEGRRDFIVVVFDEREISADGDGKSKKTRAQKRQDEALESVVSRLEEDLQRTKEHLRVIIEQHETSSEELKASNEELQAINEELRSATEELETSKEELQSVNEELITVNTELKDKIDEAAHTNADLQNLMASTGIATIFLDRNLRIKRLTPAAENIFNIMPTDIGRPLAHFTNKLEYPNLADDAKKVLAELTPTEHEVNDQAGRIFMARLHPYLTLDKHVDGVVLNFIDVTERKMIERELSTVEKRFHHYFELGLIGMVLTSTDKEIIEINQTLADILGYTRDELVHMKWTDLTHLDDIVVADANFDKAMCGEIDGYTMEKRWIRKDGTIVDTIVSVKCVRVEDGGDVDYFAALVEDITESKKIEEALRRAESHFQALIESATEYAIFTTDKDNVINSWNAGAERIFGWTEAEILGKESGILFTAEDREHGVPTEEVSTAAKTGRAEDERWHIRKDGTQFFASGVMQPLNDKNGIYGFVKICRDQTARLMSETATQDKQMLQQLVSTQEDERRRIARDLHDHFGQQMTALRLKLGSLKEMSGKDKRLGSEIEEADRIGASLDREIDFLAWELRPAALDDLGLRATLGNFVKEWSRYSGTKAEFHSSGIGKKPLEFSIETNLYRIAQEALNNIHKHARAESVSVLLEKHGDEISLIIEDDGVGFDPQGKFNRTKGIGLVGMNERAKICNGTLEIESAKGKGTTIYAKIPVK